MTDSRDTYARFQALRAQLTTILAEAESPFGVLEMSSWVDAAKKLQERLTSERFRVIVLGEFKRGKSTFINSLLGQEILPAFATPCTAIINEIKWDQQRRAVLHFKFPQPDKLPAGLPNEILQHLNRSRGKQAPPLPVAVDALERFVAIPDPTRDQAASIAETPYDYIEIFWPLNLLKDSVEIIDSPGLNEHGSRTRITMDYLSRIDAVVFVFSVHALASQTELAVIDHDVRGAGHEYIFFVCNRFDELRKQADRDRVSQYAYEQLSARTAFGREGVFFVSALDAVVGREESKPELLARSNIPQLERRLAEFLVNDRGRVKLSQPARQLAQGFRVALLETIPNQRRMLDTGLSELQKRCDEARPRLEEAERMRNNLVNRLNKARLRIRDAVRSSAATHLREVADQVPTWASQLEIESRISAFKFWAVEAQVEAVANEVVRGVTPRIEQATSNWREARLQSLIENELADFNETVQESIQDFMERLGNIRADIVGIGSAPVFAEAQIGSTERVLSGVAGLFIGGAGSAIEGMTMGYQGMLRSLVPQIAVAVGAIAILHLNPVTLVPALLAMGLFRTFRQGDALTQRAKVETGRELAKTLIAGIPEQANQIADSVYDATDTFVPMISEGLDREILSVQEQVNAVLEVKRAGEAEVARQKERLATAEKTVRLLDGRLDAFVAQLAK